MNSIYKLLSALALTFTLGIGSASAVSFSDAKTFSEGGSEIGTLSWTYQASSSHIWDLVLSYTSTGSFAGTITANVFTLFPSFGNTPVSFAANTNFSGTYGTGLLLSSSIGSVSPISPVPEPETYAMLVAGLIAVGAIARRRRQAQPRESGQGMGLMPA